jgi:hypothetical protein
MVGALLYLAFFAVMTAIFAAVVLSRPPRRWVHGVVGAVVVLVFFIVLGWAMVRFLFSAMAP